MNYTFINLESPVGYHRRLGICTSQMTRDFVVFESTTEAHARRSDMMLFKEVMYRSTRPWHHAELVYPTKLSAGGW